MEESPVNKNAFGLLAQAGNKGGRGSSRDKGFQGRDRCKKEDRAPQTEKVGHM